MLFDLISFICLFMTAKKHTELDLHKRTLPVKKFILRLPTLNIKVKEFQT